MSAIVPGELAIIADPATAAKNLNTIISYERGQHSLTAPDLHRDGLLNNFANDQRDY
jgi:hypothetical protein